MRRPVVSLFTLPCALLLSALLLATQLQAAQIIQSPNDPRDYLAFRLDNGLKALVISDPGADKAAASLEVGVGSGDDPDHSQGLAHFLEHMLFLGTDRYPEAGAYQAFIAKHGGSHNAFTAYDRTNYFFDIEQSQLTPALDRFSRFFIAPLFNPVYVDRERNAVHSEYQSRLKEDGQRQYAVLRQVINPAHPLAGFSVGSLDTLRDNDQGKLTEHLHNFYRQHYSADNMSLVVLGRQSTTELKTLVEQRFNEVAKRPLSERPMPVPLFEPGRLPLQLQIKTLKQLRQLSLTFPVPPIEPYWDIKPLHSIAALLGHEGEGSLFAELQRRGWASSLSAGPGFNYADTATLNVSISLTEAGLENYRQVVELSFQQIELIRRQGVEQWRHTEEQQLSELSFRFKEPGQPTYEVLALANKLRRYPTLELLHGDYLFRQFDETLIRAYLNYLSPDNLLLSLSSPEQQVDQIEPYYQAEYSLQPLDPQWLAQLKQLPTNNQLALPAANPFIPQQLQLLPLQPMAKPELLIDQPGLRLWHQQDQQFRVPKTDLFFSFRSPLANDNARNGVMTGLLIKLLDDQLNAFLYPAFEAGFHVDIYPHVRGFSTRISGYSDRQQQLLEKVSTSIKQFPIDADKLAIFKQELRRELLNKAKDKPYNQAFDALYQRVLSPRWSTGQQLAEIDAINAEQLSQFRDRLLARGNIEVLVHGNIAADQARHLGQVLNQQLLDQVKPVKVPPAYARQLEVGTETQELKVDHNDSALVLYLQGEQKSLPLRARYGLLASILKAPFYTELRTEKQRGYVVFASAMPIQEHPALALVIQSPSSSPDTLLNDVELFLTRGKGLIEALEPAQLESYKQGLISQLMKQEQKLSQRSNRYWQEIDKGYDQFDSREQLAAAIRQVSKTELLASYDQLQQRRLVLRSTGNAI